MTQIQKARQEIERNRERGKGKPLMIVTAIADATGALKFIQTLNVAILDKPLTNKTKNK